MTWETKKKITIAYRDNPTHEKLVPLVKSALEGLYGNDITITLTAYPQWMTTEDVETAVKDVYPTLDSWTVYLSDWTSRIPYRLRDQDAKTRNIRQDDLEDLYRKLKWWKTPAISEYDDCEDKNESEIRLLADKDITIIAESLSQIINTLDDIQSVELVLSRITDHIPSLTMLRNHIEDQLPENDQRLESFEIGDEIRLEYWNKLLALLQTICPNKEVNLNTVISNYSKLDKDKLNYLSNIDNSNVCIINDWHNRIGDPNNWTNYLFFKSIVLDPIRGSLHFMNEDNLATWNLKLMTKWETDETIIQRFKDELRS